MAIVGGRDVTRRSLFFVAMTSAMLLVVLAGFAKTFFARAYFGTLDMLGASELPLHLRLHGVILAAWFVLLLAQTLLVSIHRTPIHRQLGVAGAVLAALVVVSGLITVAKAVPRGVLAGLPVEGLVPVVFGNSAALAAFTICSLRGLALRSDPSTHKRVGGPYRAHVLAGDGDIRRCYRTSGSSCNPMGLLRVDRLPRVVCDHWE